MDGRPNVFEARGEGPKIQEACHSFLKIKTIYQQKTKDRFSENYCEILKIGTWSMSYLLPHREDIIPRWSHLLTTLPSRGSKGP